MTTQKYCVNCKHYRRDSLIFRTFDKCRAVKNDIDYVDLTTGNGVKRGVKFASNMRGSHGDCGPTALLFEPKPPSLASRLIAKLKNLL